MTTHPRIVVGIDGSSRWFRPALRRLWAAAQQGGAILRTPGNAALGLVAGMAAFRTLHPLAAIRTGIRLARA